MYKQVSYNAGMQQAELATDLRYSIGDLEWCTGIQRRTIHFYVQQEVVDKPEGSKRGSYYTSVHLIQLLQVRRMRAEGYGLEAIRRRIRSAGKDEILPERKPGSVAIYASLKVAEGVEVLVDSELSKLGPEQQRAFFSAVREQYRAFAHGTGESNAN